MPNPLEAAVRKQTDRKQLLETFQKSGGATIFEDEVQTVKKETAALEDEEAATAANAQQQQQQQSTANRMRAGGLLDPDAMARAADPDPRARVRWERKMAIRAVRNATDPFAREPRELRIKRTERQLLSKSPFLPTSQKKLVMLARQIQGKTVEDALVQMRYSKKKMAREVALQLKMARDLAIVERGMGLGKVTGEASQFVQQVKSAAAAARAAPGLAVSEDGEKALMLAKSTDGRPGGVKIQTKDKRWLVVDDPTTLYVSEAWIGRGQPRTRNIEYRARGRSNLLVSPSTSAFPSLPVLPSPAPHPLQLGPNGSVSRYHGRVERGEDPDSRIQRTRSEDLSQRPLDPFAEQADSSTTSILLLVDSARLYEKPVLHKTSQSIEEAACKRGRQYTNVQQSHAKILPGAGNLGVLMVFVPRNCLSCQYTRGHTWHKDCDGMSLSHDVQKSQLHASAALSKYAARKNQPSRDADPAILPSVRCQCNK
jgi:ribosomal protein L22